MSPREFLHTSPHPVNEAPSVFRLDAAAALRRALRVGHNVALTDVIDRAWRRWGDRTPQHLDGPFAFCVRDPADNAIYLARDPLGEAPLYYAANPDRVWVSDSLDELLDLSGVPHDVDFEALALRLARCYRPLAARTDFAAIAKVPPGTLVRITSTGTRVIRYWDPGDAPTDSSITFPAAVEHADQLLHTAVADRVPEASKVAVHLSGGLDSSTVAALTAEIADARGLPRPLAYCWSPNPSTGDLSTVEYATVEAVAQHSGLTVRYSEPDRLLHEMTQRVDPLRDPPMAWLLESDHAVHAAQQGVSTVLTGWGGDEALSLHSRTAAAELARTGRLVKAWRATTPPPGSHRTLRGRLAMARPRQKLALDPTLAAFNAEVSDVWRRFSDVVADARHEEAHLLQRATTTRQRMIALLTRGHLTARNESWSRGGARLGLTYASPLQDRRIVDFALSLPPEFFSYRGVHRRLLRSIARRHIPPEVINVVKQAGTERRREELTRTLVLARQPLVYQAQTSLGWPAELLEAQSAMADYVARMGSWGNSNGRPARQNPVST